MYLRALNLPHDLETSFFLWGLRQSGKSTLLNACYPDAVVVDLLKSDQYHKYLRDPHRLREELTAIGLNQRFRVVIDEVQRVPELLNEVHWLLENSSVSFALCSSSAHRLRREGVNLLGGRALSYRLHGLSAFELKDDLDLVKFLNTGFIPRIYDSKRSREYLDAYVYDYLATEIASEAALRDLSTFATFLTSAAISDTEIVNYTNIGADCGVTSQTVKNYYQLLVNALQGDWLPAFRKRPKRRVMLLPKFYFADVGLANTLAKRGQLERLSVAFGHAFESWVFHELKTYLDYSRSRESLTYWRLSSGNEVDFIFGDMQVAIEAKASPVPGSRHMKGLRELGKDHPEVKRRVLVCSVDQSFTTDDGIEVLCESDFVQFLWNGGLLA